MALTIDPVRLDDPVAAALAAASVLELDGRYGGEPRWGPYAADPRSLCLELVLSRAT